MLIVSPPSAEGPIDINMSEIGMDDIHELFSRDPAIKLGGHWKPADCLPRWKVGMSQTRVLGTHLGLLRCENYDVRELALYLSFSRNVFPPGLL